MLRVGRIGLDMDVVAERPVRSVEELDDAEAFVDRIEQRAVTLDALCERGFSAFAFSQIGHTQRLEAQVFLFERLETTMRVLEVG